MEPNSAVSDALMRAERGDLEGAADLLNQVCAEYREFGPAYAAHALVFLAAGDTAQCMVDLDAAEWSNREYGTPEQTRKVHEIRMLAHGVRSIFAGKNEAEACRTACEEARKLAVAPDLAWFIPAAALEHAYREADAKRWVENLGKLKEFKGCAAGYFKQTTGLLRLILPPSDRELVPAYFARYLRSKKQGDTLNAKAHLKSVQSLTKGLEPYAMLARFASGQATVETA